MIPTLFLTLLGAGYVTTAANGALALTSTTPTLAVNYATAPANATLSLASTTRNKAYIAGALAMMEAW